MTELATLPLITDRDIRVAPDGLYTLSRTVLGHPIQMSGPDRELLLETANAHLRRVMQHAVPAE